MSLVFMKEKNILIEFTIIFVEQYHQRRFEIFIRDEGENFHKITFFIRFDSIRFFNYFFFLK